MQDLCRILKISRPTVYSLLKTRQFSWINIGGRKYRISRRSFDNWLDNQM
ncbi:MAG: helix-turn-helix domain-containing protein [Eubacterium sp.]|nr:helix-turn-helix domain-containing protein [Eubacterium sp.]